MIYIKKRPSRLVESSELIWLPDRCGPLGIRNLPSGRRHHWLGNGLRSGQRRCWSRGCWIRISFGHLGCRIGVRCWYGSGIGVRPHHQHAVFSKYAANPRTMVRIIATFLNQTVVAPNEARLECCKLQIRYDRRNEDKPQRFHCMRAYSIGMQAVTFKTMTKNKNNVLNPIATAQGVPEMQKERRAAGFSLHRRRDSSLPRKSVRVPCSQLLLKQHYVRISEDETTPSIIDKKNAVSSEEGTDSKLTCPQ